ncbi:DMT family transporter [Paenirhodobacter populi]|uniref:DMT family transporter n=1 Tax=Paenirhodobacter populi TaxID=2306993 RepID=A0A443JUC6_9RHOB|nr:DMT family transporter [Sinirhodobacter populi]RWR24099.1 DMT family transporter [Sinirhodobacter populi]
MENLRGSLLMVASMLCFAIEDMFIKLLAHRLPVGEVLALIGLTGAICFAVMARLLGIRLRARHLLIPSVMARNLSEMAGTICFVCAIVFTPLSQASAIQQAAPLAVTLGAALFLNEKVGWRRWTAILVGFLGVMIIVRPGTEAFSALSLLAVFAVIGLAARDVVTRRIPASITSIQLGAYGFSAIVPIGVLLLVLLGDRPVMPTGTEVMKLLGASLVGVSGYYALIWAMRIGEISVITPFRYTRMIFALIIGVTVFGETVDAATLIGGAIVVGSGLYAIWRQSVRKRDAA